MKLSAMFEAREPKTQKGFEQSNKAAAKRALKDLEKALQKAIESGDDDHADDLRCAIKDTKAELNESVDKSAIRSRLDRLKADLKEMPKNPNTEAGIDAVDEIRSKISKLEKQLRESEEAGTASAKAEYNRLYDKNGRSDWYPETAYGEALPGS